MSYVALVPLLVAVGEVVLLPVGDVVLLLSLVGAGGVGLVLACCRIAITRLSITHSRSSI